MDMLDVIWSHILALLIADVGGAPFWVWLAGGALVEWALPRINAVKGNSTLECLGNLAVRLMLSRIPALGYVLEKIATPEVVAQYGAKRNSIPGPTLIFVCLFPLALAGCAPGWQQTRSGQLLVKVVACASAAAPASLGALVERVLEVVTSANPSGQAIVQVLEAQGIKLGSDLGLCLFAAIREFLTAHPAAPPHGVAALHEAERLWLQAAGVGGAAITTPATTHLIQR